MPRQFTTSLDGAGLRVGVVASRFNAVVTERLLEGALSDQFATKAKENHLVGFHG